MTGQDVLQNSSFGTHKIETSQKITSSLYGADTDTFFDRETEHVIFKQFSDSRLGPKLYGFFDGGRIEEFLNARTLTYLIDASFSRSLLILIGQMISNPFYLK